VGLRHTGRIDNDTFLNVGVIVGIALGQNGWGLKNKLGSGFVARTLSDTGWRP
jgi:hypothetical protein